MFLRYAARNAGELARRVNTREWVSVRVNDGTVTLDAYSRVYGEVGAQAVFYRTCFKTAGLPVSCFIVLRRERERPMTSQRERRS